jgi:LemA protein
MRTITIVAIAILCIIGLIALMFGVMVVSAGNDIVGKRNAVDQSWSNVEAAYQRRLDTIPKFAQVAKFSAEFQINLTVRYAEARSRITEAGYTKNVTELQEVADSEMRGLTIMIQQEAVPEAKTDQLTELNSEIDTVERTILHERGVFNTAVMNYNNAIQMVPGSWFNSMLGWNYQPRVGFSAQPGADQSPDIDLG